MLAYIILIFIILADFGLEFLLKRQGVISDEKQHWYNKFLKYFFKFRIITIVSFVFLSTFKAMTVGSDDVAYLNFYHDVDKMKIFPPAFEIGYTLLNFCLAKLHMPFRVLLFIVSCFISICVVVFVNTLSKNKFLSLFFYIAFGTFAFSLSGLRQTIAIGFLLLAIVLVLKNKALGACGLILLASLFHKSALIGFVFVILKYIKLNWKIVLLFVLANVLMVLIYPSVIDLLIKFNINVPYLNYYTVSRIYLGKPEIINMLYNIGLFAVFIAFWLGRKKLKLSEAELKIYDYFALMFMFVPAIRFDGYFLFAQELFNRLVVYFMPALMILIPMFLHGLKANKKWYIVAIIMVIILASLYMYYLYAIKLSCEVVPYVLSFQNV